MGHVHFDALTPHSLGSLALAVVAAWILFQVTKHLIAALLMATIGAAIVAYAFDIVTLDDAKELAGKVKAKAEQAARDHQP